MRQSTATIPRESMLNIHRQKVLLEKSTPETQEEMEMPESSEKENKDEQIVMDENEEKSNKQENKSISEYVDEEIKMSEKGETNVVVETGSCDQTEKKDILEDSGEVILTVHEIDEKTKNIVV